MLATPFVYLPLSCRPLSPERVRVDVLCRRAETKGGITMAQPRFQLIPGSRLPGGKGGVGWRLLGMNNRELGRSAHSFPDAEAATSATSRFPSRGSGGSMVQMGRSQYRDADFDMSASAVITSNSS